MDDADHRIDVRLAVVEALLRDQRADHYALLRDHEARLRKLETAVTKLLGYCTLAAMVGSAVATAGIQMAFKKLGM